MTAERPSPSPDRPELARVVERNIAALIERRRAEERSRSADERVVQAISRFTGSMRFVYLHIAFFGLWTAINLGLLPVLPRFDRSFVLLATVASVEAIFLSTIVLITQNRMATLADKRADLDLQISLLAEHEITRVITLLSEVAERMGIESANDPELAELAKQVEPGHVLDSMEASEAAARTEEEG
jgi:uncharacterized membrane protein